MTKTIEFQNECCEFLDDKKFILVILLLKSNQKYFIETENGKKKTKTP